MPLEDGLVGRRFTPAEGVRVTEERVRAFAHATGAAYDGGPAPPTFPIVVAFPAIEEFLAEAGIGLARVVHADQRFSHHRPVVPGDDLRAVLEVTSLRSVAGTDMIGTASEITDAAGEVVCTARATLVHQPPEEASS